MWEKKAGFHGGGSISEGILKMRKFFAVRNGSGESFQVEEPAGAKTQSCMRGDQQGLQTGDKHITKVK